MGVQKLALPFALACLLLAGPFLTTEAARSRCKHQSKVQHHKSDFGILRWQEACLPLVVILGGCCGLVWWVLLLICNASQKGGQNEMPQVSGEVEPPEELKTTALNRQEERTEAGSKLDYKGPDKGNEYRHVELEPCPPCPPEEQGNTTFWTYLEQELGKILAAIRSHRTTGQSPVVEETTTTSPPLPVEKPNQLPADWQNFVTAMNQYSLLVAGASPPAVDKQQPPLTGEGPSPQAVDKQNLLTGEGPSPMSVENQNPPSGKGQHSPHKERKKTPNRPRGRSKSKSKSHTAPSSKKQGYNFGPKGRSCRDY